MSLMAGFDFIAEISNATLLKLIKNQVKIGNSPINPPFEISIPIASGGAVGSAHVIVDDLQLDLNANDTITMTMHFTDSSVIVTTPLALTIAPLDGTIVITSGIALVGTGSPNQVAVATNLGAAAVALNFSPAAQNVIANALQGTPIPAVLFQNFATQAITGFIQSLGQQQFPIGFTLIPGTNGALTPAPQFEKLEVHCISSQNRASQALGIFGNFLVANHANGNHAQKNATAITAWHDVCISLSPGAFHSLVFCPAVATALGTTMDKLPTSCGGAQGFDTGGATVKSLKDTFANGHIDINGSISKSGFCYDASGSFHASVTATVSGSTLTPSVTVDPPNVSVDIPWYCWLVAGVVLGPLGLIITGVINAIAQKVADSLAKCAVNGALGNGLGSTSITGLSGASFDSVAITVEGITLNGRVPIALPVPTVPRLELIGSVVLDNSQQLSAGMYHDVSSCDLGDFPYTENAQEETGTYSPQAVLLGQPLQLQWSIVNQGIEYPLNAPNGNLVIPGVSVTYPLPLPAGTGNVQAVHVGYSLQGDSVRLTNLPPDGNYSLGLKVRATDPAGIVKEATTDVLFDGDAVVIGGGYQWKLQMCLGNLLSHLKDYHSYGPDRVPRPVPANYPAEKVLVELIHEVVSSPAPIADALLTGIRLQHGKSFMRAMSSPAAAEVGLARPALGELVRTERG